MGNNNPREKKKGRSVAQAARRRLYVHLVVLLLIFGAIAAGVLLFLQGRRTVAQVPGPTAPQSVSIPGANPGLDRLKGRWVRPDGGYVLQIRDVEASGKIAAGYFNPRPINVSRAEATLDGTTLKVFTELRDVNYPGATYHLTYDPGSDQLRGVYFQPALQQSFQVFFVRMK